MKKYYSFALCLMASASLMAATTQVKVGDDLQAAINAASAGDTLLVQAATFTGNFTMKEGVNVSGGWNETFTAQTDYATVLDGNAAGRVVNQPAAFTTLTVWENLTIQNGKDENASTGGGGAWLDRLGQLKHCLIQNNQTTGYGGGVAHNVTAASTHGEVVVTDCWIRNNKATKQGGGFRLGATIEKSIVENNTSGADGAGGYLQHGCVYNTIVRFNHSTGNAGALRIYGNTEVYNNLIYGNIADGQIGGLSQGGANRTSNVVNNTIVMNVHKSSANPHRCGAMLGDNATKATFINNIVWGNYVGETVNEKQTDIAASRMGSGSISNNAIYATEALGDNCILLTLDDPGFVEISDEDATKWDLHLLYTSKLIEAGLSTAAVGQDIDGNARVAGQNVDLGCYELPWYKLTITTGEAVITVGEQTIPAGELSVPEGFTCSATITANAGYEIVSVRLGEEVIEAVEGVYTLPAVKADVELTVETKSATGTGIDNTKSSDKAQKVIVNGQVYILHAGKMYNVLGVEMR